MWASQLLIINRLVTTADITFDFEASLFMLSGGGGIHTPDSNAGVNLNTYNVFNFNPSSHVYSYGSTIQREMWLLLDSRVFFKKSLCG